MTRLRDDTAPMARVTILAEAVDIAHLSNEREDLAPMSHGVTNGRTMTTVRDALVVLLALARGKRDDRVLEIRA